MARAIAFALSLAVFGMALTGCGGNATPAMSATNNSPAPAGATPAAASPTPAAPSPTPPASPPPSTTPTPPPPSTPTPSPTPAPAPAPSPAPAPPPAATNAGMFQALMIQQTGSSAVSGQIVVNPTVDDGSGTLQLKNAAAGATYSLQFCPYPSSGTGPLDACHTLTDFNTNSSGQAQVTFHVPKGVWAGIFVAVRNGTAEFASAFNLPGTGLQYRSSLQQTSSITTTLGNITRGGDALRSGSITVTDNTAHIVLQNATTSVTYSVTFCGNGGGSSCYDIGTISTDSTGSVAADIDLLHALGNFSPPGIFRLDRAYTLPNGTQVPATQFITGFTVF